MLTSAGPPESPAAELPSSTLSKRQMTSVGVNSSIGVVLTCFVPNEPSLPWASPPAPSRQSSTLPQSKVTYAELPL